MFKEFKPGDVIDLSQFNKRESEKKIKLNPEKYIDKLRQELKLMSFEVNKFIPNFLEDDGRITISGRDEEIDRSLVTAQEDAFSRDFKGNQIEDKDNWYRKQELKESNLTEIALTLLLNKFLHRDFLVTRSSVYDDYNNGIDNVLFDKKTGEALCGFDEVMISEDDQGSKKKEIKLKRMMEKGGAYVKYGAKLESGKFTRSTVKNVPAFYVTLNRRELFELLEGMSDNKPDQFNDLEKDIFSRLIKSLEEQVTSHNLRPDLENKASSALNKLKTALPR